MRHTKSLALILTGVVLVSPLQAEEQPMGDSAGIYAPMEPFLPFAGRTLRGEGSGPDGEPIIDIAHWELILDGRALQSTHQLADGSYGGRTIFFYDESAEAYVFHYFTTAGFHTTGTAAITPTGFSSRETVLGHDTISAVVAQATLEADTMTVTSTYETKSGDTINGRTMVYRPYDGPGPFSARALQTPQATTSPDGR